MHGHHAVSEFQAVDRHDGNRQCIRRQVLAAPVPCSAWLSMGCRAASATPEARSTSPIRRPNEGKVSHESDLCRRPFAFEARRTTQGRGSSIVKDPDARAERLFAAEHGHCPQRSAGIHDQQKKRAPEGARRMHQEQRTAYLLSNMSMICCFSCGVTGGGVSPSAPADPSASFALIAFAAGLMSTLATNPLPGVRSA